MARFLVVYVAEADAREKVTAPPTLETRMAGIAAWGAWMERHGSRIIDAGGPLGRTKAVAREGVSEIRNNLTGYVIVEAESHDEAAGMFLNHPHFAIFPGTRVEVMECPPIPGV